MIKDAGAFFFELVTQVLIWGGITVLAIKSPGERNHRPASVKRMRFITAGRDFIGTEEQLGIRAKAEGVSMFALGCNRIARGESFKHGRGLQTTRVQVGKDVRQLAIELCSPEAVFFQVLQSHVRYIVLSEQVPYQVEKDALAVLPLTGKHDRLLKAAIRNETPP